MRKSMATSLGITPAIMAMSALSAQENAPVEAVEPVESSRSGAQKQADKRQLISRPDEIADKKARQHKSKKARAKSVQSKSKGNPSPRPNSGNKPRLFIKHDVMAKSGILAKRGGGLITTEILVTNSFGLSPHKIEPKLWTELTWSS